MLTCYVFAIIILGTFNRYTAEKKIFFVLVIILDILIIIFIIMILFQIFKNISKNLRFSLISRSSWILERLVFCNERFFKSNKVNLSITSFYISIGQLKVTLLLHSLGRIQPKIFWLLPIKLVLLSEKEAKIWKICVKNSLFNSNSFKKTPIYPELLDPSR